MTARVDGLGRVLQNQKIHPSFSNQLVNLTKTVISFLLLVVYLATLDTRKALRLTAKNQKLITSF